MAIALVPAWPVQAGIRVVDDAGRTLVLQQPVQRIISLSPHITELLFAAGATGQIVGTVDFSDYPPQATAIARIGSYNRFDAERILALQPQLIIAWQSGNPASEIEKLKQTGIPVFFTEPHSLQDIAKSLRQFGELLGTQAVAGKAAQRYESELKNVQKQNAAQENVRVFYQVWHQPLMTVNGQHLISQIIRLCGGENVFADLAALAPQVDVEAVLHKNPQVIIVGMDEQKKDLLYDWSQWPQLAAVANRHIYYVDSDTIARHTPRILQGAQTICRHLDAVRSSSAKK